MSSGGYDLLHEWKLAGYAKRAAIAVSGARRELAKEFTPVVVQAEASPYNDIFSEPRAPRDSKPRPNSELSRFQSRVAYARSPELLIVARNYQSRVHYRI